MKEISDTVMLMVDRSIMMIVEMVGVVDRVEKMRRSMKGGGR